MPVIEIIFEGKTIAKKETDSTLEHLEILQEHEWRDLHRFLLSPYLVPNDRPRTLFHHLKKARENEGQERINGGPLLKKLFGGKKYDFDRAERKLASELRELNRLIQDFILYQDIRDTPTDKARLAVMALKKRQHIPLFQEAVEHFKAQLADAPTTIMRLNAEWWLEHQLYFYHSSEKYREASIHFDRANLKLRDFYHLTALRYYTECINRSYLVNEDPTWFNTYETTLLSDIGLSPDNPVVVTYVSLIDLLKDRDNIDKHHAFKAIFKEHHRQIAPADQLVLVKCAQNAANFAFESGLPNAGYYIFFWARLGVMKNLFLFENMMSDADFLNLALSGALYGKFDWQLNFMNRFRPYVRDSKRDKAYSLALAFYHFHQHNYPEAAAILDNRFTENSHADVSYTLRAKPLLIRCYLSAYLRDFDHYGDFRRIIEQLRKYVDRKDFLTAEKRAPYLNFIKVCNALARFKHQSPHFTSQQAEAEKAKIQALFADMDQLIARKWLEQVIDRL